MVHDGSAVALELGQDVDVPDRLFPATKASRNLDASHAGEPQDFALDMDAALTALERFDPELVRLVELRFYGGHPVEEVAEQLGTSPRTIKRRWRFARAWLQDYMKEQGS